MNRLPSIRESENEIIKENILNREFSADITEQKILTDITEFKYGVGKKIYICATFDVLTNQFYHT